MDAGDGACDLGPVAGFGEEGGEFVIGEVGEVDIGGVLVVELVGADGVGV